jgi:hypothetical protein
MQIVDRDEFLLSIEQKFEDASRREVEREKYLEKRLQGVRTTTN